MKKNYSFYLTLLMIPFCAVLFLSYSGGQNVFYVSGSPSDIAEHSPQPGNCTQCHNDSAAIPDSGIITLTVPPDYALNTTYSITVASSSGNRKQGFQLSAEDNAGNKVGDFTDDGVNNQVFVSPLGDRGEAVTHTSAGNSSSSWTFDWTAPATDVGPVTFYAAVNETNEDFNTTGDIIHLKQSSSNLLSVKNVIFKDLKVYPNPATHSVTIDLPTNLEKTIVKVYDFLGKELLTQDFNSKNTIDISAWQSGVYLIQLTNDNASVTKRFIKQ